MKVLTTEQIIEFVEAMPVIGNGEVVFETGINPHSIFSPAYDMFEHDRANVNVLCFADMESTVYLPFWTKEQAMLWSLGLSLPNAPRVAKNSAPYLIDADAKTALLEWLDSFICHSEEKKKMSPQEWVNFAKNMPIADANKGIFQAFNSFLDDSILRKLWGVDRIEPTRFINDREISNNSKLFQFENINVVNVEAAPAKDEGVGVVKYSFETINHINNTTFVFTAPTTETDTAPVKDEGVPITKGHSTHPPSRQIFQENEILRIIKELGFTATQLPAGKAGKPGVKAQVRGKLNFSVSVFDKAWERLRADKRITEVKKPTPPNWGIGGHLRGRIVRKV